MDSSRLPPQPSHSTANSASTSGTSSNALPARQDPKKLIKASFECIKKIMELDTQSTIADLTLLETINSSSILKFKDIETYIDALLKDSLSIKMISMFPFFFKNPFHYFFLGTMSNFTNATS
ncbi:unnamed protein product [Ambrosiozyma monospora]|uniref:Unnamed protein product n=1 Tax=Ambrosiozyma monospora TaxID=43982 RepID=A0ACB5TAG0_AMBMO|nr:unnamed protein product [Ambrosiozyma monospora]